MDNKKLLKFKRLWGESLTEPQRDKLVDTIIQTADRKALDWLFGQSLSTNQRDKVFTAIIPLCAKEGLKHLWDKYLTADQRDQIIDASISKADEKTLDWLWKQYLSPDQKDKVTSAIIDIQQKSSSPKYSEPASSFKQTIDKNFEYDFFICHASEDKNSFVRPLAEHLRKKGFKVWYDEFTLTIGDSLRRKIDYGLANSCFGIVILSKYLFEKEWPQKELDGLVARDNGKKKVILPIWHRVTKKNVEKFSPILAGKLAVSTDTGLDNVVNEILKAINKS